MRKPNGDSGKWGAPTGFVAGWLALLLALPSCTGIRVGPIGLGIPVVRADRKVTVSADWCPDGRHVVVWKHTSKSATRVLMLLVPIMTGESSQTSYRMTNEILLFDITGRSRPRKLGEGRAPRICPRGSYVAYFHQPTTKMVWVNGKDVSFRHLWLLNYATGERWRLERHVGGYSFSRDGKWLKWNSMVGPRKIVDPEHPNKTQTFGTELAEFQKAGWSLVADSWSRDGAIYVSLNKDVGKHEPALVRWVRFAPPEWQLEEVGPKLSKKQREDLFGRANHPLSGPGGVLRIKRKRFKIPDLLILPGGDVDVKNVYLELPDGTTRRVTHFRAPWW